MNIIMGDRREVTLDKSTVIASGGEAVVHVDPDYSTNRAIKVYHSPAAQRGAKLRALGQVWGTLGARNPRLLDQVAAPLEIATDRRHQVVGFGMHQFSRAYTRIKALFESDFCNAHGFTSRTNAEAFVNIGEGLTGINGAGLMVGDFNDGGILIHQTTRDIAWVDVDSWHMPQYPCTVGTEFYLCPLLYGIDLGKTVKFEPWHDWYSFSVMLFRALLRKHPFKAGLHPQFNSLMERAKRGITVLDHGVTYPSAGLKPEILSDELAAQLLKHLKLQERGPFPLDLLRRYSSELVACKSCNVWYPKSRAHCPQCAAKTVVDITKILGITVATLLETRGRILHTQLVGDVVACVAEEDGKLVAIRKERNQPAVTIPLGLNADNALRFGFFGANVAICRDDLQNDSGAGIRIVALEGATARAVTATTTNILAGRSAVFATSKRYLYRLAQGTLLACETFGSTNLLDRPVTMVFPRQSWFICDPNPSGREVLLGVNRDMANLMWFTATGENGKFSHHDAKVTALEAGETVLDMTARFNGNAILLMRKTRLGGKERVRLDRLAADTGASEMAEVIDPNQFSQWESIHGKAFAGNVVVHPTDDGIVREVLQGHASQTIGNTKAVVSSDDEILPFEGGLVVVRHNKVLLVTKK